ncbi:hypothetical protein [Streptomyces sp. NPDC002491]
MQSFKRPGRTAPKRLQSVSEPEPEGVEPFDADGFDGDAAEHADAYDTLEMYRVICPDCAQPIALLADEESLPEHALCASPWNPFGLTVCAGTGRTAAEARPADDSAELQGQDTALLLTLPQGLDWRTQPFSHVGGPGSRPMRVPAMRRAAA